MVAPPSPPPNPPPANGKPLRVMVVEDDAVLGMAIEDELTKDGFAKVTICPSAKSALGTLEAERFDAVVLDVYLADSEEGYEIAELVRALGSQKVQIVFQTGAPGDIPDDIRELGLVLTKPYDLQQLREALAQKRRKGLFSLLRSR